MASFTFGSVGDIIAIVQIVQSAVSALNDARGSAADYQALGRSLSSLAQVLTKIDNLTKTRKDVINMAGLEQTLSDCFRCVNNFYATIEKYSRALGARGQKNVMRDAFRKIQWLSEKDDVTDFQRNISTYLAMLQLLIQLAGFEINAVDQATLRRRMSETNEQLSKGFADTYTLLEKIDRAIQLHGEGGVSNAAIGVSATLKKRERRATLLADEQECSKSILEAYNDAVVTCKSELIEVVRECRRVNKVFADPEFDIDYDLRSGEKECLISLDYSGVELQPGCVRRVNDIFENPQLLIEDFPRETVVSLEGYEYFAAVLTTLQARPTLIHRLLIARDEQVDAYGFIFFRDGEYFHTIIDSRLHLERPEYSYSQAQDFRPTSKSQISENDYQKMALTGSKALYFAASSDQNETVIPLLEKAYARVHGDYGAIRNLYIGDVLEDFTGGVTIETDTTSIFDKEVFWKTMLQGSGDLANDPIVFASNRRQEPTQSESYDDMAIVAVLQAVEIDGNRLIKLLCSNPEKWEWTGAWSDGSIEWTPEWMMKLNHRFGDEGITWISYRDFMRNFIFATIHRVFPSEWQIAQLWAAFEIPWAQNDLQDAFQVTIDGIPQEADVVIVLSQLDSSYFKGLEGQYEFELDFTIFSEDGTRIARAGRRYATRRSNNLQLTLWNGSFLVRPHVTARKRDASKNVNNVILTTSRERREKLLKAAYSYDLAHAKVAGWRAVNEMVQEKKQERTQKRRNVGATEVNETNAPPTLRSDDVLRYDDWDAVAALGLRVLAKNAKTSVELKRYHKQQAKIQPPPGTTMSDYDSEEISEIAETEEDAQITDRKNTGVEE